MKEKAQLIIMSYLSDVQQLSSFTVSQLTDEHDKRKVVMMVNFVKYIIMQTNGNLNIEIDPDEMWKKFLERNS